MTDPRLELVPLQDIVAFQDALIEDENRTLAQLLKEAPAFSVDKPLGEKLLERPVGRCLIKTIKLADIGPDQALYAPPWTADVKPAVVQPAPATEQPEFAGDAEQSPGGAVHGAGLRRAPCHAG